MQGKLYGQNQGGGLKLNGSIKDVYAEENVAKGDLLEYIDNKVRKTSTSQFVGVAKSGGIAGALINMWTLGAQEGYITNGLVAHFSGEDGYVDKTWVDRVNGYKFTQYSTTASNHPVYDATNKLYQSKSYYGGMVSDFTIPAGADFSFEVVTRDIKNSSSANATRDYAAIVGAAMSDWSIASGGIVLMKNKTSENKITFSSPGSGTNYALPPSNFADNSMDTFTYVPNVGIFHNGVRVGDANPNATERKVGLFGHYSGSYAGNYYRAMGKIHCVRVYNRQLTAEEVAQNHAEDIRIYGE